LLQVSPWHPAPKKNVTGLNLSHPNSQAAPRWCWRGAAQWTTSR